MAEPKSYAGPKHRYTRAVAPRAARQAQPEFRNLAFEILCNAFPSGAIILDSGCRLVFANHEGTDLIARWNSTGPRRKGRAGWTVPTDIVEACHKLRLDRSKDRQRAPRPRFGGRILLRNTRQPNLTAVIALERSPRDRRVAVFCVFLHDRLRDGTSGGRRDQLAMLTVAERRVAKHVAEGMRNREIASALGKSVATVKSQLGTIFAKLQVASRTQLAAALRSG